MKKELLGRILLLLACFNCLAFTVAAQHVIYVATNGNDAGAGTSAAPLSSIQAAIDKAGKVKADTIYIRVAPGQYAIDKPIVINNPGSPVVVTSNGKGNVVITGYKKIPANAVKAEGKYWKLNVKGMDTYASQLCLNDRQIYQAMSPQTGWDQMTDVKESIIRPPLPGNSIADSAVQQVQISAGDLSKISQSMSKSTPALLVYSKWDFTRTNVISVSSNAVTVAGKGIYKGTIWKKGTRFRIANAFADLQPGTWVSDKESATIYYYPKAGESVAGASFSLPVTQQLLLIRGRSGQEVSNVFFRGLTFKGSGSGISNDGIIAMQAAAIYAAALEVDYARNINFEDCAFEDIDMNGIWLRAATLNSHITSCFFNNIGMGAIKIGEPKPNGNGITLPCTGNNTVKNCLIQNGGNLNPSAAGIAVFQSGNNIISNNDVSDFYYTGITMGWTWGGGKSYAVNNLVSKNHVHHIGKGALDDMGGIYLLGNSAGTQLVDNVIHHIYSYDYGGWGIYLDIGSANIKIMGNLVMNTKSACFFQSTGKNNEVSGNIFINGNIDQLQLGVSSQLPDTSILLHDNIILKKGGEWFSGSWKSPGVYIKNNTFGMLHTGNDTTGNGFTQVKAVEGKNNTSKYTSFRDIEVDAKDDYSNQDINALLSALKINKTYTSGSNSSWTKMANSKKKGFYNGFTSKMKSTTLFRKDQVGR